MPEPNYLSTNEVVLCIEALSAADYLRLAQLQRAWSVGIRVSGPDDLLHETLTRLIEGRRKAPRHLAFTVVVAEIMHSLADELRVQQSKFYREMADGELEEPVPGNMLEDMINEEILADLERRVGNDNTARDVLKLKAQGYEPAEICERLSIRKTTYDSAIKRIRRAVLKEGRGNE